MSDEYLLAPLNETAAGRDNTQLALYTAISEENKLYTHFAVGAVRSPLEFGLHHTLQYCLSEWMKEERQPHAAYLNSTPIMVLASTSDKKRRDITDRITQDLHADNHSFRMCLSELHRQYVKQAMSNGTDSKRIGEMMQVATRNLIRIPKWVMFNRDNWRLLLETNGIAINETSTHGKYSIKSLVEKIEVTPLSEDDRAIKLASLITHDQQRKIDHELTSNEAYIMDANVRPSVYAYVKSVLPGKNRTWTQKESDEADDDALDNSGQRCD